MSTNLYRQTLDASYALRDAMRQFEGKDVAYPHAALAFAPAIPKESSISSDFKVQLIGLDDLPALLQQSNTQPWSLDRCRAFALRHGLTSVASVDAAIDQSLFDDERLVASYTEAFARTYAPLAANLVPFSCREGNKPRLSP